MEISTKFKERGTVITAVLTLAVIGVSLIASTWQNMLNQQKAEEQHLALTSRAVLLALENSLRRGSIRLNQDKLAPRTKEIFTSLEEDGEVIFAGLADQREGKLLTASDELILPPPYVFESLYRDGEWQGRMKIDNKTAYVHGKLFSSNRSKTLTLSESPEVPLFLLVGLDSDHYLSLHKDFRKNIIFQAAYTLVAALVCWILAFSFLSRRNQAKRAQELELFQDKLIDNLPDGLIILGSDNTILAANPAVKSIFQVTEASLVGKSISVLPTAVTKCIATPGTGGNETVWQRVSANGAYLELLTLPTHDEDNTFLILIRDRTVLRTLEQNLADAEKLAMVGTLAAGVAHEVRNPLSALRGFAQYFLKKLKGQQPEEEYARTMVTEADRLNRVITDLLFLARPKRIAPQELYLPDLVHEIRVLLRFDLEQKQTNMVIDLQEEHVFVDADALKQSLLNLLLNSLDALDERAGETITIGSGKDGKATWIEVRDSGCGMTKEQQVQAFEPFFTAKKRGTGLGLSLVQRTLHDHGGTTTITSVPGQGCTIRLTFPDMDSMPLTADSMHIISPRSETHSCDIQLPLFGYNGEN